MLTFLWFGLLDPQVGKATRPASEPGKGKSSRRAGTRSPGLWQDLRRASRCHGVFVKRLRMW